MMKLIKRFKAFLNEWVLWPLLTGLVFSSMFNVYRNIEQDYILTKLQVNYDSHITSAALASKKINLKLDMLLLRQNQEINIYKELISLQSKYIEMLEKRKGVSR